MLSSQEVLGDGDKAAMRFIVNGTHAGNLWGIPATGNHGTWNAVTAYRFIDGKVAEPWATGDWDAILHCIGVFIPPWLIRD